MFNKLYSVLLQKLYHLWQFLRNYAFQNYTISEITQIKSEIAEKLTFSGTQSQTCL